MSDAMTVAASLGRNKTMWDRAMYYDLRPELYFDRFAEVKSTDATPDQGGILTFTQWTDMAVASTALNESVDVDAVALADAPVSVTLVEYGNAAITSFKARATAFIPVDEGVANVVGFNAGVSQDTIARDVMKGGSNVIYGTGGATDPTSRNTIEPSDTITSHDIRLVHTDLLAANVATFGGKYAAVIHPHVQLDIREEVGSNSSWREPHVYSQPQELWNGEIGDYEGFRFMSSPRAPLFADAGSSTTLTDVYRSLFFGRQAVAKAYSTYEGHGPAPTIVFGPVVDKLNRFQPVGWHWFGGYGIFRQAALRAIESSSSVGANS